MAQKDRLFIITFAPGTTMSFCVKTWPSFFQGPATDGAE